MRQARTRGMQPFTTTLLLGCLILAPSGLAAQCAECVFPGEEWERLRGSALTDHGWDADGLETLEDLLRDSANTTGLESWHRMIELLFDAKRVEMLGPYPWAEAPSSP